MSARAVSHTSFSLTTKKPRVRAKSVRVRTRASCTTSRPRRRCSVRRAIRTSEDDSESDLALPLKAVS